jgi:hypothetical protein
MGEQKVEDIRAGVSQAKVNEDLAGGMSAQFLILAIVAGLASESWWVFGGVFLGLPVAMLVPGLGTLLVVALTAGWGYCGYHVGDWVSSGDTGGIVVITIISVVVGGTINLSGREFMADQEQEDGAA